MTGVIKTYGSELGLKRDKALVDKGLVMRDMGECHQNPFQYDSAADYASMPPRCAECVYNRQRDGPLLIRERDGEERALCHYQGSKTVLQEQSLKNTTKFEALRRLGTFRVNWQEGFDYVVQE